MQEIYDHHFIQTPLSKHAHCRDIDEHFAIYQEYVDHISVIKNDNNIVDHIKKAVYLE